MSVDTSQPVISDLQCALRKYDEILSKRPVRGTEVETKNTLQTLRNQVEGAYLSALTTMGDTIPDGLVHRVKVAMVGKPLPTVELA